MQSKGVAPARNMRAILAAWRAVVLSGLTLFNASCGSLSGMNPFGSSAPPVGQLGHVQGFLGGVVADEPRAALVGRDVLSLGGNAADAAVAVGLALAVTLPSRASLGAGGACLAYSPGAKSVNGGTPQAIMFLPRPPAQVGPDADRPAAVPMLARGLYLLHARYGRLPFESLVVPAERMARFGIPVSRALANDLSVVAGPLMADPAARAVFSRNGTVLKEGDPLVQQDLAATLTQLRVAGVGDLYQGTLARRLAQASPLIGGPMTFDDLRRALPTLADPLIEPWRSDKVAFLPPPADGGLAAAAAFETLRRNPGDLSAAAARSLAVAARWRQGGATPDELLKAASLPQAALPPLPASTTWATLDRDGNAVVCAASLDNLFGTGRIVPGMGFLLAVSPASVPMPLFAAALAWNANLQAFRAEVGGSGQEGAALAAAAGMVNALTTGVAMPAQVPDPGRANAIGCAGFLPGEEGSCRWATDPRGAGLAVGGS
ncbi:MAG TPA: gamma-glutamyltransferase [Acetobacteraceae bacterium]|nr:gamma-glutamyltransferase [Acetobacteraceae bacterium]